MGTFEDNLFPKIIIYDGRMGQAKDIELERLREQAELEARTDHVAKEKGFVCQRCDAPLPRGSWGIEKLCSYCQQIWDHLG
jgi:hypothetical protein